MGLNAIKLEKLIGGMIYGASCHANYPPIQQRAHHYPKSHTRRIINAGQELQIEITPQGILLKTKSPLPKSAISAFMGRA